MFYKKIEIHSSDLICGNCNLIKKCKVLHFVANNPKIDYAMNHEDKQVYIDNYSTQCDLQVIIYFNPLFDNHIDKAVKRANKTLGLTKRNIYILK